MNLRRIEVFLAVAEAGGFTAAADRLHIVQSAVSATIRDLEEELGSPLFIRGKRPLQLTPPGRLLFERAAPALQELESAHREVRELQVLKRQRLRVAAPPQVTQVALARVLADFMALHPQLQLKLVQAGALEAESMALKGEVDISVLAVRAVHPDLETRYLWHGASTACFPASWPAAQKQAISWDEFLEHPLAIFPPGYHLRAVCERQADRMGRRLSIAVETNSITLILEAVRAGVAAALLPVKTASDQPSIVSVRLGEKGVEELGLIGCWRRDEPPGEIGVALLDYLHARRPPVAGLD